MTLSFVGDAAEEGQRAFFRWLVDGGGEDVVMDILALQGIDCEIESFSTEEMTLLIESNKRKVSSEPL